MLSIIVCGDFRAAHPERIKLSDEVAGLFANAGLCICNFEAPIHTNGIAAIKKSGPALSQSEMSPAFLIQKGFNVILLANNHIMDYGKCGSEETKKAFGKTVTVGVGEAKDAFSVCYIEINGKRIGFCSLVQKEFGTVESEDDNTYGAAWINSLDVPDIIRKAKKQCNYLLIFPHAGVEHTVAPLPEWRRLYKRFIDWGADAVVASHPHCPQGWEDYKCKRIYYSLGNFYFDELTYNEWWYKSIAVELSIDEDMGLQFKEYFLKFDTKGLISIDNSVKMSERIVYANHLLNDNNAYIEYIDKLCEQHYVGMRYGILRGVCGVSLRMKLKYIIRLLVCMIIGNVDEMYLLNAFQCESHRWVIERYLRNNNK